MKYKHVTELKCNYCKEIKVLHLMVQDSKTATGYKNKCKECHRKQCAEYAEKNWERRREIEKQSHQKHRIKRKAYRKKHDAQLRHDAITAYGGYQCSCECGCDTTQPLFLTIDHINGEGKAYQMRKESSEHAHIYRWLKKHDYPEGYQVLCMNCNQGKWRNRENPGVCPGRYKKD